ncbi:unnamed protein product [Rhizoctonia solani]|uniref:F-box domain-containing protein n=1 Tax=Rhizoctonia solani TaxID=456999 RepID=A0A8H2XRD3_9AGAM|nr:unnamed protein product [Rhizoctonia solani]
MIYLRSVLNYACNVQQSPSTIVRRWEEVGSLLSSTLKDYLALCLSLENRHLRSDRALKDLPARIDSSLLLSHPTFAKDLARARSSLARTRNQLASPSYRLPVEVLYEIFLLVLYERDDEEFDDMRSGLQKIYHRLHCLLDVCSVWRQIGLSQGILWSIVPIFYPRSGPFRYQATNLSLQRAGGSVLHLGAIVSPDGPVNLESLSEHASRFRTINISSCSCHSIRRLLNKLLERGHLESVSELSIQQDHPSDGHLQVPEHVITHDSPRYTSFARLVNSVSVLRIRGAHLSWDALAFSAQLVELQLQNVFLGPDSELIELLRVLSSVSQLRDLKLISISTFNEVATPSAELCSSITFTNLRALLLEDLHFNTLRCFLTTIISGPYSLALYPTQRITETRFADGSVWDESLEDLQSLLRGLPIDKFLIDGDEEIWWFEKMGFRGLLELMPSLKTLHIHSWDFDENDWEGLKRPHEPLLSVSHASFPKLEGLHLTCAGIFDEGIKDVVTSHPIQNMVLGANFDSDDDESSLGDGDSLEWEETLIAWLASRVPKFRLTTEAYIPFEFRSDEWRLW